ncbi:MAG: AMP-binding protein [Gammaproteobacteria bacterium]|nr:AMP-binding protein [Gammaproteobacteria bacterium]
MAATEPSYAHAGGTEPLIGETIGKYFDRTVVRFAERDALIIPHQQIHWNYRELQQQVDDFAAGLVSLGLKPGDRVGVWAPNCWEWIVAQYATAKAGLIQVNINPAYRLPELEYALTKVGCRALVSADSFKSSNYIEMLNTLIPELRECAPDRLESARFPKLDVIIRMGDEKSPGMLNFAEVSSRGGDHERQTLTALAEQLQFDDAINIQFTSGTTGTPKGATLSHHNILNNAFTVSGILEMTEADRLAIPVPLYHCFGMVMGSLACVVRGSAMVLPSPSFEPLATLETVAAERCTMLHGVPTMFIAQLEHPEFSKFDLTSLRTGIMAGSPCPVEVMKRVISDMHMNGVTIAYGMTELSPVSTMSTPHDTLERRVSTVGQVIAHVEAKVVDENNHIVARGEAGEFCARGYGVMIGYWDDPGKTAESIDTGGWMHTGDRAVMDDEGYVNIVGRIKDMVIRGGENIFPREIEEFLYQHPKIQDVSVFGVPDDRLGEELCAWIRPREGEQIDEEEIRVFCQGKLAHFKIPRYIRMVDDFPMTVTGKLQKFVMREVMSEDLGLTEQKTA